MKFRILGASLGTAALALLSVPVSANLIVNGNFPLSACVPSGQTCPGWIFTPSSSGSYFYYSIQPGHGGPYPTNIPSAGSGWAFFGGTSPNDEISQTNIPTVGGGTYTVSFSLISNEGTGPGEFKATFDGNVLLDLVNTAPTTLTSYSYTIIAAGNDTIAFFGYNFRGSTALYDVDLSAVPPSSMPEPSTWALMLIGFAGVGCVAYRRQKKHNSIWILGA